MRHRDILPAPIFCHPAAISDRGWLISKRSLTVPSTEVAMLLEGRFASVAGQFVPNLVQRYDAYLGRIGQPDLDSDVLRAQVCK